MKPAVAYKTVDHASPRSKFGDVLELAKVRLNTLVVATTAGGYYMAAPSTVEPWSLGLTCLGTALVASGASAVNQVQERDTDALMERTRSRPLAEGRMRPSEGLAIASAMTAIGLAILWTGANGAATIVALATFLTYVLFYTPLKRRTSLATVVGAVPGALPPLIGWGAVRGNVSGVEPWTLFVVMFVWQLPHFLAIAWMYREDYGRAGLPMLPVVDRDGLLTGQQALLWAGTLVPVSQLPFFFALAGGWYAVGALLLGLAQLAIAFRFARHRSVINARHLFLASIVYLPLLWALMAFARI